MSDQLAHFSHHHTLPVSPAWTRSPFSLSLNSQKQPGASVKIIIIIILWLYNVTHRLHKANFLEIYQMTGLTQQQKHVVCKRLGLFVGAFIRNLP